MAFPATCDGDIRTTASADTNSGIFDTAGTGTDFSQQDSPQQSYTDIVIDAATNTNCTSVARPFSSVDVGNSINIVSGTGFTVQTVVILSVAGGIATCDKSLGTLGSTGGTGALGGAKKTPGAFGALPIVAGNRAWIKYHASNVYSLTSASSNVANGRISLSVGTAVLPVLIRGYETTHGDNTGNRPTIRWGVNAASASIIACNNVGNYVENIIFDGNRTNFTLTRGVSLGNAQQAILGCKFTGFNSMAISCSGSSSAANVIGTEITDCVTTAAVTISSTMTVMFYGCTFHDNLITCISSSSTAVVIITRCIFDTSTTAGTGITFTSTSKLQCNESVFYNMFSHGVDLQNSAGEAQFTNCVFEANGGYGVQTSAAGVYGTVRFLNCAFYNNTTAKYDVTKILAQSVFGEIVQSAGSFFTNAASGDFTPNNTAGQGALLRAAGYPTAYPGDGNNYQDVGAVQHQDSGGGGIAGGMFESLIVR